MDKVGDGSPVLKDNTTNGKLDGLGSLLRGEEGLTLQEFQDWMDSLSTDRHAQTVEVLCQLMFSTEHDGESLPQFRLRVKRAVLDKWAAADRENTRAAVNGLGVGRELGLPGYYRG